MSAIPSSAPSHTTNIAQSEEPLSIRQLHVPVIQGQNERIGKIEQQIEIVRSYIAQSVQPGILQERRVQETKIEEIERELTGRVPVTHGVYLKTIILPLLERQLTELRGQTIDLIPMDARRDGTSLESHSVPEFAPLHAGIETVLEKVLVHVAESPVLAMAHEDRDLPMEDKGRATPPPSEQPARVAPPHTKRGRSEDTSLLQERTKKVDPELPQYSNIEILGRLISSVRENIDSLSLFDVLDEADLEILNEHDEQVLNKIIEEFKPKAVRPRTKKEEIQCTLLAMQIKQKYLERMIEEASHPVFRDARISCRTRTPTASPVAQENLEISPQEALVLLDRTPFMYLDFAESVQSNELVIRKFLSLYPERILMLPDSVKNGLEWREKFNFFKKLVLFYLLGDKTNTGRKEASVQLLQDEPGMDRVLPPLYEKLQKIKDWKFVHLRENRLYPIPPEMDQEIALLFLESEPKVAPDLVVAFQDDFDFVLKAVSHFGMALQCAGEVWQDDERIVEAAMRQNPDSLRFASPRLQEKYHVS